MALIDLKLHFITVERPYKERTVEVFEQAVEETGIKKAVLPPPVGTIIWYPLIIILLAVWESSIIVTSSAFSRWSRDSGKCVLPQ